VQAITDNVLLKGTPTSVFNSSDYAIVQNSRLEYYWIGKSVRFAYTCAGAGLGEIRGEPGDSMLITIASMKGGVRKSTLSTMLAIFVANQRKTPVTVIDLDPQRGATILLLGARHAKQNGGLGTCDILQSEVDHIPSSELFHQARVVSPTMS